MFTIQNKRVARFRATVLFFLTLASLYAVPIVLAGGSGSPTPTGC